MSNSPKLFRTSGINDIPLGLETSSVRLIGALHSTFVGLRMVRDLPSVIGGEISLVQKSATYSSLGVGGLFDTNEYERYGKRSNTALIKYLGLGIGLVACLWLINSLLKPDPRLEAEENIVLQDRLSDEFESPASAEKNKVRDPGGDRVLASTNQIFFGDYEPVEVKFRSVDLAYPEIKGRLADSYELLAEQARNDNGEIGFVLFQALDQCTRAYSNAEDMERAIEKLYATHLVEGVQKGDMPSRTSNPQLDEMEASIRGVFARCEGITAEQKNTEKMEWLKASAAKDFLPAVGRLAWRSLQAGDDELALINLEKAWSLGDSKASGGLYELYKKGTATTTADPISAAAFLYLSTALFEVRHVDHNHEGVIARIRTRNKAALEAELLGLSPNDVDNALQQARSILVQNSQCCVDW